MPLVYWMTCLKSVQARRLIAEHLYAFKDVKSSLTGHDLQNMGLSGRSVGEALNALKLALMDGDITSRVDEIDYVSLVFADSINDKSKGNKK